VALIVTSRTDPKPPLLGEHFLMSSIVLRASSNGWWVTNPIVDPRLGWLGKTSSCPKEPI